MKKNEAFILRNIYGKLLLMPIKRNEVGDDPIYLNEVAGRIWELCDENNTREDVVNKINTIYNLDEDSVEQNSVEQFLNVLIDQKIIFE